jgi:transcription elongation factor Elf1
MLDFDSEKLAFDCPGCGKKIEETIGRLKRSPTLTCRHCGAETAVDAKELAKGLDSTNAALAKLEKSLKGLGKFR